MPQLTYNDIKNKILKRERFKVKLTQSKSLIPIFSELNTFFSKTKGQKRFVRLVRFYINLPGTTSVKLPNAASGSYASPCPKVVNFVRMRMATLSREFDLYTMIPAYNFLRGEHKHKTDTETHTVKGLNDTTGNLLKSDFPIVSTVTNEIYDPLLQETSWKKVGLNYIAPGGTGSFSSMLGGELLPDISGNPSNSFVLQDVGDINTSPDNYPHVVYDFYGQNNPTTNMIRKTFVRPSRNSTAATLNQNYYFQKEFTSDKKYDSEELSEIGYNTDTVYIDLWENIRSPIPSSTVDTFMKSLDNNVVPSNTSSYGMYADIDKRINMEKYHPYDEETGIFDTNASTFIAGRTNENPTTGAGLEQYCTAITAILEFEIILVDMAVKK